MYVLPSPGLMAQVQVPPSTLSTFSVHEDTLDTDDTNGMEGMSLTTSAPTGNRNSQPMQWFEDRGFHMPKATKYLTISTYSLLLLLPPVALDTTDITMTDDLVQHEDSTLVQHATIPCLLLAVDVSPIQGIWFHKKYTCCFQQGRLQDVLDGLFQILECYPIVINYDPGDVQLLGDIVFFPLLAKPPDYGQIPGQYILQHRRFLQVQLRRNILVEFVKLQPWPSRWLCLWTDMETRHSYTFFSDPEQLQADEMSNPTFIRDYLLLNPWLLVESSCARTDFGGSGTLDNMYGILPYSLPPAETPDTYGTCGTLMHPHSRMDIIFLGVPVVWSHFKMDTFTEFQSAERTLILEARMMHVAAHLLKSVIRNILRRPTSYLSCWDSMTAAGIQ